MRKFLIVGMAVCLLSLTVNSVYPRVSQEWIRWARGDFEIPPEIQKVTSVAEIQPFLDSKNLFTRMAAARRLGELEDKKKVSLLLERFAKETPKPTWPPEGISLVRLEIIRTLEKIGGEEAKSALLGILRSYWKRGPKVKDKKYAHHDGDYITVVPVTLKALYKWNQDNDVFTISKEIALNKDLKKYFGYSSQSGNIRQNAWHLYLKGYMPRQGIKDEKDSAKYLLDFMEDISKNGIASESLEHAKAKATNALFRKHSEAALSSLQKEFEEKFAKEPRDQKGGLTKRHNELRRKISYIRKILKGKRDELQKKLKEEDKDKREAK